jgi:hypothetical protein
MPKTFGKYPLSFPPIEGHKAVDDKSCRPLPICHERFAQALARGKAATEAYVLSGYKANDGNASRMKGNERISAREFRRSSGAPRSGPKSAANGSCGN